jgi:calcineurin-like phosphoesterase family protein
MNECLVDNWNEVVKPQDKVYHLGDVYMGGGYAREDTVRLLQSLNGKKRLILGNHDNGKDQILQNAFQKIDVWRMFPEFGLLLTHVPVHESTLGEGRFLEKKFLNVHGHIHNNESPSVHHQCVCVEHTDYRPVNIEELRIS